VGAGSRTDDLRGEYIKMRLTVSELTWLKLVRKQSLLTRHGGGLDLFSVMSGEI
jgi:hypothetical protein